MISVQMPPCPRSRGHGETNHPGPHQHRVAVVPMRALEHATQPDDDWSGLKDRAERRKRQTRLNVRAHRQRKAAEQQKRQQQQQQQQHKQQYPAFEQINTQAALETPTSQAPPNLARVFKGPVHPFSRLALDQPYHNLFQNVFPLSSDHLIPIIEYNVYRATLTNIHILSLFQVPQMPDSACFLTPQPPLFPGPQATCLHQKLPTSLQFTDMQRATPHEMWIDMFPSPQMRDNAIVAVQQGRLHQDQICGDLLRGLCGAAKAGQQQRRRRRVQPLPRWDGDDERDARMIVWTTPWEAGGWEVTEGFVRKYGFLLKGCKDLLLSTNRYRRQRGDEDLVWEVE